jgi:hypothetical protein
MLKVPVLYFLLVYMSDLHTSVLSFEGIPILGFNVKNDDGVNTIDDSTSSLTYTSGREFVTASTSLSIVRS